VNSLESTRRSLHAVAELLLAGPQWRRSRDIRLRVLPGGFGTVVEPDLRVQGTDIVGASGTFAIVGTAAELAARLGIEAGVPDGVYADGSGVAPDDELSVQDAASEQIMAALAIGDEALARLSTTAERVLWPEHFDIGIRLDEVNYGVSPGDGFFGEPYAYVGVDHAPSDAFWNAPFGAARPVAELGDVAAVLAFFTEGRERAHSR
jgi:hypothetical protein